MSVFYYDPSYNVESMINEPLVVWEASTTTARLFSAKTGMTMMDLHEDSKANTVTATFELPGKISENYERDGYVIRERRFGKIARMLQLPQGVKETEVKAAMENGLLTITFPNPLPSRRRRRSPFLESWIWGT
ncbi:hypothetical protein K438DRAFT_1910400 [Mycena galopus ATCC 62051]|nr:hypothetical protein K438DRAFT_1910400 [Mycena galopus ATCC 62051]